MANGYGRYRGGGYRIDTIVEDCVIIEHKTVDQLLPIHEAQLLTYMKLGNYSLGYLFNWNMVLMKNGIKRLVYHYQEPLKSKTYYLTSRTLAYFAPWRFILERSGL
jgi:hypothetical protein